MGEKKYRDAVTGEYVTKAYAKEHPDTTVSEATPHPDPTNTEAQTTPPPAPATMAAQEDTDD